MNPPDLRRLRELERMLRTGHPLDWDERVAIYDVLPALLECVEALERIAVAFTAWADDHNDGTYKLYKEDESLEYWWDDDLMEACSKARMTLNALDRLRLHHPVEERNA